jgi:hypothetical protein
MSLRRAKTTLSAKVIHNTLGEIRSHFLFRFSLKAETHSNYGFVCIATPLNGEVDIQTRPWLARRVCDTSEIYLSSPSLGKGACSAFDLGSGQPLQLFEFLFADD